MGGKLSTTQDNKAHNGTAYHKPTNQHWSTNYVPESRAPVVPASGPFPSSNYNPPSANVAAPTLPAAKLATGAGVGGGIGGLPLKAANPKEVIVFHSSTKWREYFEASKQSNKLVVIYFTATWCGPCKYMEPTIKELAAKHTNVDIVKIDVDELFNVSREYGIQAMPTFLFMKNGKEIDKVIGAKKEDLQNKVEKHCNA